MYIPRKLFVSQLAARKKSTKLMEAQNVNIDGKNVFQESKMFHQTMFFYLKLYKIQHLGDILVWHKLLSCHLLAISSLPDFRALQNYHDP